MANKWTDDQLSAIENRGGTLLVSAAAGSGKTAVLVERVIRRITDNASPCDIDSFLIVTYTNAAAAEMRGKIADAVTAKLSENPSDNRLRRQLYLIHKAQITTVHSFCLKLIREHFNQLGLSPDFRICDENEGKLMREAVLEDILEEFYDNSQKGFSELVELLSAGRDDKRLTEVILETYGKLQSHLNPNKFLEEIRNNTDSEKEPFSTNWGRILKETAVQMVSYGQKLLEMAVSDMESCPDVMEKYLPAFSDDLNTLKNILLEIENGTWDSAVEYLSKISFEKLGQMRNFEDKNYLEQLKGSRKIWKDLVGKLQNDIFCYKSCEIWEDDKRMSPAIKALSEVTQAFMDAFAKEKRRRNLVDFNDLEHFALELLTVKDSLEPSVLALELSQSYTEIMVDEYQDTNSVQDAIFNAVSKNGKNIFMVGDVKQSIYRFRLANPNIFLSKYKAFVDAKYVKDDEERKIILSKNFRSRYEVLESANYIFKEVMSEELGDLKYDKNEFLYKGAQFEDEGNERYKTELCVLDMKMGKGEEMDDSEEQPDKAMLEAQYVAGRIFELLKDGFPVFDKELGKTRPAVPSDFVILLRSVTSKANYYQKALENFSISARTDTDDGLLSSAEISAVVSLLAVIDNPHQDIPLIGAMRSPLFGFSEDELAKIRINSKKTDFYTAVKSFAENGDAKTADFLKIINEFRIVSADMPVYQLIWYIYDKTSAMGRYGAMKNGAVRQKNLVAFFEQAKNYENQGYKGLFRFVSFIRSMIERDDDFTAPILSENNSSVRIMSIHKSKGLEFPIVILADCAKIFNEDDFRKPILIHSELGIGPKCRDLQRGIQYPSVQRLAISSLLRKETMSEELRVLYVAMTRPKEKLIITCALKDAESSLNKWAQLASMEEVPSYALSCSRSYAMWLILPMLKHPSATALRGACSANIPLNIHAPDTFDVKLISCQDIKPSEVVYSSNEVEFFEDLPEISPKLEYKTSFLADIPSKITATSITNSFKEREAQETTKIFNREKALRRPHFDKVKNGLTPSEIGIAHHMVMQFADFSLCETLDGVDGEIKKLADKKILSIEQANAVSRDKIFTFFKSELYKMMKNSLKIRREFKFSVLVPAEEYYPEAKGLSEEKLLLQGVVDCLIETEEGFLILDFKTDRINKNNAQKRAEEYLGQLSAYQRAIEEIFEKKVIYKVLFFFETGQTVFLK